MVYVVALGLLLMFLAGLWLGYRYGYKMGAAALAVEQHISAQLRTDKEAAVQKFEDFKTKAAQLGIDLSKILLLVLAIGVMCHAQAQYGHDGTAVLQDAKATPGVVDAQLTKEKLCDPAFHTGTVRNVTQSQKVRACRAYGITEGCPGKGYELDHLVSIELGGANDDGNLWPQPVDGPGVVGYHTKDVVENRAHRAVCAGDLTLAEAQEGIRTDWYSFGLAHGWIGSQSASAKAK